jgi:hypothetical protein
MSKFSGDKPRTPIQRGGEGKDLGTGREGRDGRGREGRGEKERGWDGKGRERERSIPQIKFYDYSTVGPHPDTYSKERIRDIAIAPQLSLKTNLRTPDETIRRLYMVFVFTCRPSISRRATVSRLT